ncbi:hotdog fold thioesterase [Streptomyces bacillaris]|uniref:hotdog fold thioesterase n=1 Tax=Streptomyces bacillaris TaxID=68179 RepID=UPI0038240D20
MTTFAAPPAPEAGPKAAAAWVNEAGSDTLAGRMGLTFLEAAPRRVVATMPVTGNTQLQRMLHGGASAVLAESLGSLGAALHAGEGRIAVGVDINATHHLPVRSGTVTGVATALHLGGSTASYEVVITDEAGRRVCTARITCAIHGRRKRG